MQHITIRTVFDDENWRIAIADAAQQTDNVRMIAESFHQIHFVQKIRLTVCIIVWRQHLDGNLIVDQIERQIRVYGEYGRSAGQRSLIDICKSTVAQLDIADQQRFAIDFPFIVSANKSGWTNVVNVLLIRSIVILSLLLIDIDLSMSSVPLQLCVFKLLRTYTANATANEYQDGDCSNRNADGQYENWNRWDKLP